MFVLKKINRKVISKEIYLFLIREKKKLKKLKNDANYLFFFLAKKNSIITIFEIKTDLASITATTTKGEKLSVKLVSDVAKGFDEY